MAYLLLFRGTMASVRLHLTYEVHSTQRSDEKHLLYSIFCIIRLKNRRNLTKR
ncbi:hypothetical protein THF1C08_70183 [Vibrio jasicida]|uniref:Uncharacterized protein n=1 Tax=Vibrio jasicida TaxID=766224 RepID=A0AAU9QYX9_9VIBR|nr:hypothetical protein THF1C08_70183 [Vibrio jasicida]CAH1602764.1 hypothetical protein THF1A12_60186 [Vibrio jasicida]